MNSSVMISTEIGGEIATHVIPCTAADAAAIRETLAASVGLIPGEVAQRLGACFAALQSAQVERIDTSEMVLVNVDASKFPPPPGEMDMTPPAPDAAPGPADPSVTGIPTTVTIPVAEGSDDPGLMTGAVTRPGPNPRPADPEIASPA